MKPTVRARTREMKYTSSSHHHLPSRSNAVDGKLKSWPKMDGKLPIDQRAIQGIRQKSKKKKSGNFPGAQMKERFLRNFTYLHTKKKYGKAKILTNSA